MQSDGQVFIDKYSSLEYTKNRGKAIRNLTTPTNRAGEKHIVVANLEYHQCSNLSIYLIEVGGEKVNATINDRLENALIEVVERFSKQSSTAAEVEALAAVAQVLADMQKG